MVTSPNAGTCYTPPEKEFPSNVKFLPDKKRSSEIPTNYTRPQGLIRRQGTRVDTQNQSSCCSFSPSGTESWDAADLDMEDNLLEDTSGDQTLFYHQTELTLKKSFFCQQNRFDRQSNRVNCGRRTNVDSVFFPNMAVGGYH